MTHQPTGAEAELAMFLLTRPDGAFSELDVWAAMDESRSEALWVLSHLSVVEQVGVDHDQSWRLTHTARQAL